MPRKPATPKAAQAKVAPKIEKKERKPVKKDTKKPLASDVVSSKKLDLCLLLDCTASMGSWIQRSKDTLCTIIDSVKTIHTDLTVRVSFVGYRDIMINQRFIIKDFNEDLEEVKAFIAKVEANSDRAPGALINNDTAEDVQGGMNEALKQSWSADSVKQTFLICDAPGHGKNIN